METCERCGSTDLFQMDVTIAAGPARFAHCRSCEHRAWTDGTRVLELCEVLAS